SARPNAPPWPMPHRIDHRKAVPSGAKIQPNSPAADIEAVTTAKTRWSPRGPKRYDKAADGLDAEAQRHLFGAAVDAHAAVLQQFRPPGEHRIGERGQRGDEQRDLPGKRAAPEIVAQIGLPPVG